MAAAEIAHTLSAARRAVRLYPPEHPAHREAVRDLVAAVTEDVDVRPLQLNLHKGRLFHGSEVLTDKAPASRAVAEAMQARRIESITFHVGFADVDAVGLSEVLSLRPSPDLEIQAELDARGVRSATVSELVDESLEDDQERDRRREADRALYRQAISALGAVSAGLAGDAELDPALARRALGSLIVRVAEDREAMLALARMTGHGDRSLFHAVGVMLQALVLGHVLGLADQDLLALGVAALLHDAGRAVSAAAGASSDTVRQTHPVLGAQALGALLADEDCSTMQVAYEHHMGVDGSGWPTPPEGHQTHPYSRMVAVSNRYDELTRPENGPPTRCDLALAQLLREASGGPLDPILCRLFAQNAGVFPIGSVVRLSDHSVGVVCSVGPDPLRPHIRQVLDGVGHELRPPIGVDLAEDDRSIVEVIDPALLALQPADYM